ncbi:MAG: ABC transporter permease [Rhizobiales bacterium]|nr:ABC transporter permease [Hyphomicrobiales bacterium]
METLSAILIATLVAGTPLVYAALGELVTEKSGVLNLGVEGMMLFGAVTAFAVTHTTHNLWLGVFFAAFTGACLAAIFGVLTLTLKANQVASGLALAIFGAGASAFVGKPYVGVALSREPSEFAAWISGIPLIGPLLVQLHPLVYLSWVLFAGVLWFLYRTHSGLVLRAIGESPSSAHSIGYPVNKVRFYAVLFGGAMAGIAGAYLAVVYTSLWTEGMTAGRGWIALALVVFATWRPERVLLGAYLFGGVTTAQLFAQGAGIPVPPEAMSALPYLATILVLVLISRNPTLVQLNAPASLGKLFHGEA